MSWAIYKYNNKTDFRACSSKQVDKRTVADTLHRGELRRAWALYCVFQALYFFIEFNAESTSSFNINHPASKMIIAKRMCLN